MARERASPRTSCFDAVMFAPEFALPPTVPSASVRELQALLFWLCQCRLLRISHEVAHSPGAAIQVFPSGPQSCDDGPPPLTGRCA